MDKSSLLITFFTFLGRNENEIWISRFRRGSQAYWTVRTLATMDLLLGFDFNEPFSMQCSKKLGRFTICNESHFLVKRSSFIEKIHSCCGNCWYYWPQMCLVSVASGLVVVVYVFTGFEPKYRCAVPLCENVSATSYGLKHEDGAGFSFPDYVEAGIPKAALDKSNLCQYYGVRQEVLDVNMSLEKRTDHSCRKSATKCHIVSQSVTYYLNSTFLSCLRN